MQYASRYHALLLNHSADGADLARRAHAAAVVVIKGEPLTIQDGRFQRGDHSRRASPLQSAKSMRTQSACLPPKKALSLPSVSRSDAPSGSQRLQSGEHILLFRGADHGFVQPEAWAEWRRRRPARARHRRECPLRRASARRGRSSARKPQASGPAPAAGTRSRSSRI